MISKFYLEEFGNLEVCYPFTCTPFFAQSVAFFKPLVITMELKV